MNQTIGVNITPQSFQPTLHYSQGDVGRVFVINVTDYDIPTGATVTCVATKPSGMGFTVSGTVSGNSVTFTSTAEMTDEWGRFPAEIRIASGNTLLGTANFLMIGEKDPHPASTIDGTQEELIPQLTLLVNRVEAAAESVHDLTVSATTLTAGSDATATYDSTNNSIAFGIPRGADGDVTRSEFNDLKSDINDNTGTSIVQFTKGGYITTNGGVGTTVSLTPTSNSAFCYATESCSAGDAFKIKACGWTTGRLWAFLDSDNKILAVATNSTDASVTPITVIAPLNAVKAVFNTYTTDLDYVYHGKVAPVLVDERLINLESSLYSKYTGYVQGALSPSGAFATNASIVRTGIMPVESIKEIISPVGYFTRLCFYTENNTSSYVEKSEASRTIQYIYTASNIQSDYPTAKYCAIHYQKYSGETATSVTPSEIESLKLITLQTVSELKFEVANIETGVARLLALESQHFCIENETITQTFHFDVPYKDMRYKNQIIECWSMYTGDTAPTIEIRKRWYNATHTSLNDYGGTNAYPLGYKGNYRKQAFRVAPFIVGSEESFRVTITVPTGTTLYIKRLSNLYDDSIYRDSLVHINAHGLCGFGGPPNTNIAFGMASKLGYKYCITIPKFTADNPPVYVCFHDDDNIQGALRNPDGTTIDVQYQNKPISDFTYDELMAFDAGLIRGEVFAGEKVPKLEDFFKTCARSGMHPMLSVHPSLSGHWENIKAMAKRYGVLHHLNIKSDPTSIEVPMSVLLDDIESYTIDTSDANAYVSRFNSLVSTYGITNAKKVIEFNYTIITDALISEALEAGYSVGCFNYGSDLTKVTTLIEKGVTEFTEDYNASVGLNW